MRFATFEADFRSGELRKGGLKIKLQPQPFRILALLLENPGEVVTRERLQLELWPGNTNVEFDLGLNSAIKKLRASLHDDAQHPRYVETLPRIGYRFVFPVEVVEQRSDSAGVNGGSALEPAAPEIEDRAAASRPSRRRLMTLAAVLLLAVAVGSAFLSTSPGRRYLFSGERSEERLAVLRMQANSRVSPDGSWLAYRDAETSHLWLRDLDTGESRELVREWIGWSIAWSPDSRRVAYWRQGNPPQRLEIVDVATGKRTPVASDLPGSAIPFDWGPDGRLLCYVILPGNQHTRQIALVSSDDGTVTPIRYVPEGTSDLSLSPDGRFILYRRRMDPGGEDRKFGPQFDIFLIPVHGDGPEVVVSGHPDNEISPFWSPDGTKIYFVRNNIRYKDSLWMVPIHQESGEPASNPVQVAQLGDMSLALDPTVSNHGDLFISRETEKTPLHLIEVDPVSGAPKGEPYSDFPIHSGAHHWSADGEWLGYRTLESGLPGAVNQEHAVERNLRTGEERLVKLRKVSMTPAPWFYSEPAAADWVVYAHQPSRKIIRHDLATGHEETLLETGEKISQLSAFDDGREILYATYSAGRDRHTVRVMRLADRGTRKLAVSRGKPQWSISPNGQAIAMVDYNCLILLNRAGGEPRELSCEAPPRLPPPGSFPGMLINYTWISNLLPSWSPDGSKIAWTVTAEDRRRVELQIVDRFTGENTVAWAGEEDFYTLPRGPKWSPDGTKIAFSIQNYRGHEVWVLRGLVE